MSSPEERFSALFESTHVALLGYAVRRVTDPADAADVVAETFLVAWRRLDDVPAGEQARPWLFGSPAACWPTTTAGSDGGWLSRTGCATPCTRRSRRTRCARPSAVERALERLPDDDRELLRLLAWEELARDEIAVAMGLSRGAVRVRLHRARTQLRQAMEDIDRETDHGAVKRISSPGHDSGRWAFARRDPREEIS